MSFWNLFTDLFLILIGLGNGAASGYFILKAINERRPNFAIQVFVFMYLFFLAMAAYGGAGLLEQLAGAP